MNEQATALIACKEVYDLPGEERQPHGELLAELAPRFIKEYRVEKIPWRIEVDIYSVPGLQPLPEPWDAYRKSGGGGSRTLGAKPLGSHPSSGCPPCNRSPKPQFHS